MYDHERLKEIVGTHLYNQSWKVNFEFWDQDMDSTYRYDIVARKEGQNIAVEVKTLDIDIGQIWGYILQFKSRFPNSRFYLGVECSQNERFRIGEFGEMIEKLMKTEGLGMILANRSHFWVFDDYESFITAQEGSPLCVGCQYCKQISLSPANANFFRQFEPELRDPIFDRGAICSEKDIVKLRKQLLIAKKEVGVEEFERKTHVKVKDFPKFRYQKTIEINAPCEKVFDCLTNEDKLPRWVPHVLRVERIPKDKPIDVGTVQRFICEQASSQFSEEIVLWNKNEEVKVREVGLLYETEDYIVESTELGTELTMIVDCELPEFIGPVARERTLDHLLDRLKSAAESF
ncbi:MAG: SRPBCC family protein [Candidatus Bathyarchaeia archaeon]